MTKIIRTATVPSSLYILLKGQLKFLNNHFDIIGVSGSGDYLEKLTTREGIKVTAVKMERKISVVNDLISLYKLTKCFIKERPYIVHSITPKAGLLSMIAGYVAGVPIRMHTFTGLIFPSKKGSLKWLLIIMDRLLCKFATNVYPEGNGVKSDLINYKITSKPLKVLANGNVNGVDLEYFNPANIPTDTKNEFRNNYNIGNNDFVFIYAGRLVNDKGINELIEAFIKLNNNCSTTKLLLVGTIEIDQDPLPMEIIKLIKTHHSIIYANFQDDLRPFYAISDVLVFPSYREGFPNVVLEAGAMTLPSIVTNINGSNEIIVDKVNGIIIPPKDKQKLFEAMNLLFTNSDLLARLKLETRNIIASKFDHKIVWEALLSEYKLLHS